MKKRKVKKREKKLQEPMIMPEAVYELNPDDIEIGDDIIAGVDIKKEKKKEQ